LQFIEVLKYYLLVNSSGKLTMLPADPISNPNMEYV